MRREIVEFAEYWLAKSDNGLVVPPRGRIDPLDIPRLLPAVWITDVFHDPFRMRYRLLGSAVVDRLGSDPTGQWVDEAFPAFKDSGLEAEARKIANEGVVTLYDGPPLMASDPDIYRVQRITAPLSEPGEPVNMLIGMSVFLFADEH